MIEIPGYTMLGPLGQGGMSSVVLAEQHSLHRQVALKLLLPGLADDRTYRERFLREARLAAKLHHPNIVAIHDVGEHQGVAYIAMAYEPGGTVADLLVAPLAAERALSIARDVARALDFAHEHGVVHRDVKPENILCRRDGSCLLSDFGIAAAVANQGALTREGMSLGTPGYMSPEQLRGDRLDGRSDLYSLGVVLFQMLTGKLPFEGQDSWSTGLQHLYGDVPRLPAEHKAIQGLIDTLLAKEPIWRPNEAKQVLRHIDALLSGNQTESMPTQPDRPAVRPRRGFHRWAVAGMAAVLVGAGVAWSMWPAPPVATTQQQVQPALSSPARPLSAADVGPEARHWNDLGRQYLSRSNPADLPRAVEAFDEAIALAPDWAEPYAGLVSSLVSSLQFKEAVDDSLAIQTRALRAADRAVQLDPELAAAYAARATLRFSLTWDWQGAEADFARALALDPSDSDTERRYGLLLASLGRLPEAIALSERATRLDPTSGSAWNNLGYFRSAAGDYPGAREALMRALQITPGRVASLFNLGVVEWLDGQPERALEHFRALPEQQPLRLCGEAMVLPRLGEVEAGDAAMRKLLAMADAPRFWVAATHIQRDEIAEAEAALWLAFRERDYFVRQISFDPLIAPIRGSTTYVELLSALGLERAPTSQPHTE